MQPEPERAGEDVPFHTQRLGRGVADAEKTKSGSLASPPSQGAVAIQVLEITGMPAATSPAYAEKMIRRAQKPQPPPPV